MRHQARRAGLLYARAGLLCALAALLPTGLAPPPAAAQQATSLDPHILLRTGLRLEPAASERRDGFDIFDARIGAGGRIGLLFDYRVLASWEDADRFELLDARLDLPLAPEARIGLGQFKAPFGQEFLRPRGETAFLERSEATLGLVPGRQLGVQVGGVLLEERLTYAAGLFNGNGRRLENDDGRFLYAARVQYNTVGAIEFYQELVVQVGANVAFSRDSAAPLGPGLQGPGVPPGVDFAAFEGDRLLWGGDLRASWRGLSLDAEYLRGEFEPAATPEQTLVGEGGYVQAGYGAMGGLVEGLLRWDAFHAPATETRRDFLLVGVNLYPGFYTRLGLQYAISLREDQPPGAGIAGGQFAFFAQVDL